VGTNQDHSPGTIRRWNEGLTSRRMSGSRRGHHEQDRVVCNTDSGNEANEKEHVASIGDGLAWEGMHLSNRCCAERTDMLDCDDVLRRIERWPAIKDRSECIVEAARILDIGIRAEVAVTRSLGQSLWSDRGPPLRAETRARIGRFLAGTLRDLAEHLPRAEIAHKLGMLRQMQEDPQIDCREVAKCALADWLSDPTREPDGS
jgi:hypothetical protein